MKQLKQIESLQTLLKSNQIGNFFFFDYDGVLVPIQKNPLTAYLPKKTKKILLYLSKLPNTKVGLVSGRDLNTLKKLTGIKSKEIILIGTHGLEIYFNGKTLYLCKPYKKELEKIKKELISLIKDTVKGFIENKPYSFAYHIRDTRNPFLREKLKKLINSLIRKNSLENRFTAITGKNVVEVTLSSVSKGKAIEKVISSFPQYLYVYFGDDITDISAFKTMKKHKGISVSLNPKLKYKTNFLIKSQTLINSLLNNIINRSKQF